MAKHAISNDPEVIINYYVTAESFGAGHKFDLPDLKEPVKHLERRKDKILVVGSAFTKCSISAPEILLNKIELKLKDFIGKPIGEVERLELN